MKSVTLLIDDVLYPFYEKVGQQVGKTPEQVMSDALFRFAGEASLQSLDKTRKKKK